MSIQRCEYEITTTRGDVEGKICTLTGRGCLITDLLQVDNCQRRLWAKQYHAKHAKQASPEGPAGPLCHNAGTGVYHSYRSHRNKQ